MRLCVRRLGAVLVSLALMTPACDEGRDGPRPFGTPDNRPGSHASKSPKPSGSPNKDGDGKKNKNEDPITKRVPGGATLTSLPPKAEEICIKGPPLSRACPLLVPQVKGTSYLIESFGRPGGRFQVLELAAGAPSNNDFSRNAPPRVSHLVIEVGKPGFLIDLGDPVPATESLEGLLEADRNGTFLLEPEKEWDWKTELVLAPPFPSGGAHGDHVVYSWTEAGYEHRISLHAWMPADELVKTLHAIVRSARSP